MKFRGTTLPAVAVCALAFSCSAPRAACAQSASINGSLGNFDVANNQQQEAHGFEIEFEGVHPEDISSTFDTERYGAPTIVATDTGAIVRWASAYNSPATGFTATTAAHDPGAPLAGACYQWAGAVYDASGCEHFGVTLLNTRDASPTAGSSRTRQAPGRSSAARCRSPSRRRGTG